MQRRENQGIPLVSLFLVMATVAVVAALVHSATRHVNFYSLDAPAAPNAPPRTDTNSTLQPRVEVAFEMALGLVTILGFVGGVSGMGIGAGRVGRARGFFWGGIGGIMAGSVTGLFFVCPPKFWVALGGGVGIVLTGALARVAAKRIDAARD